MRGAASTLRATPPPPSALSGGAGRRVRLVLGCAIGLATGFSGLVFGSFAIFLKPIAADFDWTRAETSAAVIMSMLGLAIGAPLLGWLMDRLDVRLVIAGSVVALAAALGALSLVGRSHLLFALCWLVLGAVSAATGPNGYLTLLPRLFDRRLGLALSCAMVGVGVGVACTAPLADALVRHYGWRHAYQALAALGLTGGGAALLLIGATPRTAPRGPRAVPTVGLPLAQAVRDRRFVILAITMTLGGASGLGITFHTAAMLDDRGFAPGLIATIVALSGIGVMIGRFAGGVLMDFIAARLVGCMTYAAGAIAVTLLGLDLVRAFPAVATGGLLLGFALGAEGDFAAFVVRRYLGLRAFAAIYGLVFSAFSIGSVAGVILCGRAFDLLGDYRLASAVSLCGFLVAAVLVLALGPYRYAEGEKDSYTI